jgi:hypothetical protein
MYFLACLQKLKNKFKEHCSIKICMIFYAFDFKEHSSLRGINDSEAISTLNLRNEVFM